MPNTHLIGNEIINSMPFIYPCYVEHVIDNSNRQNHWYIRFGVKLPTERMDYFSREIFL